MYMCTCYYPQNAQFVSVHTLSKVSKLLIKKLNLPETNIEDLDKLKTAQMECILIWLVTFHRDENFHYNKANYH